VKHGGIRIALHNISALVSIALASATDTIDRSLNLDRFLTQWERDQFRGRVAIPSELKLDSDWFSPTAVHWKNFRRYVLANRHKILHTRKEMEAAGEEYQDTMMQYYTEDMDNEFGFGRENRAAYEDDYF